MFLKVPLNLLQVLRRALRVQVNQAQLPAGRALRALRSPTTKTSSQAVNHHKVIAPPPTPRQMFPHLSPPPTPTNPRAVQVTTPPSPHLVVLRTPRPTQASPQATPPRPPRVSQQALAVAPAETPHLTGTPTLPATHPAPTAVTTMQMVSYMQKRIAFRLILLELQLYLSGPSMVHTV